MSESDKTTANTPSRSTASDKRAASPSSTDAQKTQSSHRSGATLAVLLSLFALLIAGGGIGAGYWVWLQLRQTLQSEQADNSRTLAAMHSLEGQIAALAPRSEITALQQRFEQRIAQLQQQLHQQAQTVTTLKKALAQNSTLVRHSPIAWKLAEIAYLLRIARYQLDLMRNVPASLAALQAADQQLAALGNPELLPVRQALAKEISILRQFRAPDRTGVLLELSQLMAEAGTLSPTPPSLPPPAKTANSKPVSPATPNGWRGALEQAWSAISSHIIVRHYDHAVGNSQTASELLISNQVLELQLEAAAMAVMKNDESAYRKALEQAISWLNAHYSEKASQPIKTSLTALLNRPITAQPPRIGTALAVLQKLAARQGAKK